MKNHAYINSNPSAFDSNCATCDGKARDSVHNGRYAVRVAFDNGNSLTTEINGNPADIQAYYLRNEFNLGDGAGGDLMATATAVEFI